MDEDKAGQDQSQGRQHAGLVVMVSGLFGMTAAALMYYNALSMGEDFLQDSLLLISSAAILGAATFIFGLYLYIRNSK